MLYIKYFVNSFPTHIISHLGDHLEFLQAFKEFNLLYNKYVLHIPGGGGGSIALRRKKITVRAVCGPKWHFSAWRDDQNCAYDL